MQHGFLRLRLNCLEALGWLYQTTPNMVGVLFGFLGFMVMHPLKRVHFQGVLNLLQMILAKSPIFVQCPQSGCCVLQALSEVSSH